MDGKGGNDNTSKHEKQKFGTNGSENTHKSETKSLKPWDSTAKLNTQKKDPDTSEPRDIPIVKHDPLIQPFGPEWMAKQLDIARQSGYLQSKEGSQQLRDQTSETDAGDKNKPQSLHKQQAKETQRRQFDGSYRLFTDYQIHVSKIIEAY
ncbi:MAG TPA: hypothetical protein VGL94_02140 [Ktedonobacteraceae bacterium]|jgi:hypothetical protein